MNMKNRNILNRHSVAIDLVGRRFHAVEASGGRSGGLVIHRVVRELVSREVDIDDAAAVGKWIGKQLEAAGFPKGKVIVALAREHVSLKRFTLPTDDRFEIPDMTRFAMQREVPIDPGEAVIDFIPGSVQDGKTSVLVAAIRKDRLADIRTMMKAANQQIEAITLRCLGVMELLLTLHGNAVDETTAWLGVDVSSHGVELNVLHDGMLRFSRAAEVMHVDSDSEFADAVVTETRRSWMSYRIVEDAPAISGAVVLGDRAVTDKTVSRIEKLLGVKTEPLDTHPNVDTSQCDIGSAWPLAGLLLQKSRGADLTMDFTQPRMTPDRHAGKRQITLAAAGLLLVVGAGLFAVAHVKLQSLRDTEATLQSQVRSGDADFWRAKRDQKKLEHLDMWDHAQVDWLAHLNALQRQLPPTNILVLDEWSGTLRYNGVNYDRRADEPDEKWQVPMEIVFTIDGEAASQPIADSFRESFVNSSEYTALPTGPDTRGGRRYPFPFKLSLITNKPIPTQAKRPDASDAAEEDVESTRGAQS